MSSVKLISAYIMIMVILTSCMQITPNDSIDQQENTQTLKVLYATVEAGAEAIIEAAKKYEAETGIPVELNTLSYNSLQEKVFSELASHSDAYDVIAIDTPWTPKIIQHLEPLSSYLQESERLGELNVDDFITKVFLDTSVFKLDHSHQAPPRLEHINIHQIIDEGYEVWSLPIQSNVLTVSYRKDLFEDKVNKLLFQKKYGEALEIPETLEQYLRIAQFFTRDTDDDGKIDLYGTTLMAKQHESNFVDFKSFLTVFDVQLFDEQLYPIFNKTPNAALALETYGSWINEYEVTPPNVMNYSWDEVSVSFEFGQVAMGMNYHDMKLHAKIEDGKVGYFMFPGMYHNNQLVRGPHFGSWGIAVNKYSTNKENAFQLANYLTSSETQAGYLKYKQHVTRSSAVEAAELLDNDSLREYYQVLGQSLHIGVGRPRINNYDQVSEVIQIAVRKYLLGKVNAQQALDEAAEEIKLLMSQAGY